MAIDEVAKQLILDYKQTFGSAAGKRVLDDIKRNSYYDRPDLFVAGQPDVTCVRIGLRTGYVVIREMIDADPDQELQESSSAEAEVT